MARVSGLLAVPNVSEGRDPARLARLAAAFDAHLLDVHSDADHHRAVFTLAGAPGRLAGALVDGARAVVAELDVRDHSGAHPRVGVLDVAPIVYRSPAQRGAACAEALVLADRLAEELELPVFLYGLLSFAARTRAELRRGGWEGLAARLAAGELTPDFGPPRLHPSAGAVLVTARPPLVAFNLELAPPAGLEDARAIAAAVREGGPEGLPGVRAIGLWLARRAVAQVSLNIEEPWRVRLADVVAAVARHARPAAAELVGLAPEAAFEGFPDWLPVANRRTLEEALTD
jgi:glutamate formiminotransferase/glutamate formiminotransferase/formiminotetrahydrofolate cyclodeaminase